MNFTNPYTILEIDKYSTTDDIRKAYKSLMMKHHPDTGDGDRAKFDEVRLAYIQLKDKKLVTDSTNVLSIIVPISKQDLSLILGTKQTFECHDVPFDVFVPYETRMNDTLVIKNILGNLTLKVKFKETNE
jgi:preprotein translocase subunit Sec63|tara:strand:+ start:8319 stop:8708 length:390 start_codon:yes stop_codon:yes gene_type:complete